MHHFQTAFVSLVLVAGTLGLSTTLTIGADVTPAVFVMKVDGTMVRKVAHVDGFKLHNAPRWSRDGKWIAFSCQDGPNKIKRFFTVNVDGSQLRTIGEGVSPDWSPDDKQLAFQIPSASIEQRGTYVQNVDGRGKTFLVEGFSPRWSPDGSQIACSFRGSLMLRDLLSGADRVLVSLSEGEILAGFDWSPDGKRLAYVAKMQKVRKLFIVGSSGDTPPKSRLQGTLDGTLSWSPDGERLAIGLNRLIQVIKADDDHAPKPIPGQVAQNREPAWSPDGLSIAFISDRSAPALDRQSPAEVDWALAPVRRHEKGSIVYSLAYTPDGRRVVMGGDPVNEGVQVWDTTTDEVKNLGGRGIHVAMFPDGQRFATSWHSPTIQILKIDSAEVVRELDHGDIVRTIAVSKDGSRLVSGGLNNLLHVWDMSTGQRVGTYDGHQRYIARAQFSPDGKEVFSAGEDKQLLSWDAVSGKERLRIAHPDAIWSLAISPDGGRVLTGTGGPLDGRPLLLKISQGQDNAIRLWETNTGKLVREMRGHSHAVFSIDISPDGRLAVSGGWDGTIRLWSLETGRELSRIEAEQGRVAKVVFSPDGTQVIAGGGGRRLDTGRIAYFPNEQVRIYKLIQNR